MIAADYFRVETVRLKRLYVLVLHRARQSACPPRRLQREPQTAPGLPNRLASWPGHCPSGRRHPASSSTIATANSAAASTPSSAARASRYSNSGSRATGERNRRALRPHRPRRMPRLAPNSRQTAPRTGAPRLRSALRRPPAAQGAQPRTARPSSWNPARAQRITSSKASTNRSISADSSTNTASRPEDRDLRTPHRCSARISRCIS